MDLYGTQPSSTGKEIQCSDCGHRYHISFGQRSSRCSSCGNIEFLAQSAEPLSDIIRGERIAPSKSFLPTLEPIPEAGEPSPLENFRTLPDGFRVQELLIKYQVEWQLWAMVVRNFSDPAYHGAYLSHVVQDGAFAQASARYQEHRSVMAVSRDCLWQAEVSDLMLERLQNLSAVGMRMEGKGWRLPSWFLLLPLESRMVRIGWVACGMLLAARLVGAI